MVCHWEVGYADTYDLPIRVDQSITTQPSFDRYEYTTLHYASGPNGHNYYAVVFVKRGYGVPNEIRTRVATLKGWCPRPLDDGDAAQEVTSIGV